MPEKILTIDNSTFFVTCRIGEEPQNVQKMPEKILTENGKSSADKKSSAGQVFRF